MAPENKLISTNDNLCPVCGKQGAGVKNETVRHLVKDNLVESVGSDDYSLCMTEDCEVVYFKPDIVFYRHDLTVPVWFKNNANPRYICYCNRVTQEQIENAVINGNARTVKDVARLTGAMKNGQCLLNNPTGKCCGPVIQQIIDNALLQK
ncbi:MAG: (2Fe-2S)-binding protein [Thermincola ferriacetica]